MGIGWSGINESKEAKLLAWKLGGWNDTKKTGKAGECQVTE